MLFLSNNGGKEKELLLKHTNLENTFGSMLQIIDNFKNEFTKHRESVKIV